MWLLENLKLYMACVLFLLAYTALRRLLHLAMMLQLTPGLSCENNCESANKVYGAILSRHRSKSSAFLWSLGEGNTCTQPHEVPGSLSRSLFLLQCRLRARHRQTVSLNGVLGLWSGLFSGEGTRKEAYVHGSTHRSTFLVHTPDDSKASGSGWAGSTKLTLSRLTTSITSYSRWL